MVLVGASVLPPGLPEWTLNKHWLHESSDCGVDWICLGGHSGWEAAGEVGRDPWYRCLGSGPDSAPNLLWDLSKVIFPLMALAFHE